LAFHGKQLKPPQSPSYYPEPEFVSWHVCEVFQGRFKVGKQNGNLTMACGRCGEAGALQGRKAKWQFNNGVWKMW